MARVSCTRAFRCVMCVLGVFGIAAAQPPSVRSSDRGIAALINEAESRSPTFRDLVRKIERTDGIVYVERGRCGHGVHACLSLSVVAGEGYRLLRILVDGVGDPIALMATIGHELQHAVELLAQSSVRSTAAAFLFYEREAPSARDTFSPFETTAAVRAGLQVENDLRR